jgi:hypothetical protein
MAGDQMCICGHRALVHEDRDGRKYVGSCMATVSRGYRSDGKRHAGAACECRSFEAVPSLSDVSRQEYVGGAPCS